MYDLHAVNTIFAPKKGKTVHTYLRSESKDDAKADDYGLYVGERVACSYKGRDMGGEVIAVAMNDELAQDNSTWTVKFDDGYTGKYDRTQLGRMLSKAQKLNFHRGKQIDHIMISNRWKTGVTDCRPTKVGAINPPKPHGQEE